jgi:Sulfotransferase family
VHLGVGKELHFFDGLFSEGLTEGDIDRYHGLFARPPGELVGEWSPRYMHSFWTPRLLHRAAPEARILVMLRDPLERYRSGLSHELSRVGRPEKRRRGTHVAAMCAGDALSRSLYAPQLERILEHYPREQVLVLQYERCVADAVSELRRTYAFIGAEPADHEPSEAFVSRRGPSPRRHDLASETEAEVLRAIHADLPRLRELVPDLDLDLWPSFREAS